MGIPPFQGLVSLRTLNPRAYALGYDLDAASRLGNSPLFAAKFVGGCL